MNDNIDILRYSYSLLVLLGLGLTMLVVTSLVAGFRSRKWKGLVIVMKRDFVVRNADTGDEAIIFAGMHAVERTPNPCTHNGIPWIVMQGTRIGMPEDYWRRWEGECWAHFQVEIRGLS